MDRRLVLAVAVALAVVLAGCAGAGSGDAGPEELDAQAGGDAGASGDGGDGTRLQEDAAESQPEARAQVDRAIIRTGTAEVEVENFSTAQASVVADARARGGYVAGSDARLHREGNETWQTGYVVVRVPAENFSAMVESARGQGTVLSVSTETEDVTDRLVDLNARLENLRSERDQLRALYERANSTEETLRVQERLSDVQADIERLEAQKRSLENQVAYSTLRVELREPRPDTGSRVDDSPLFHEQSPVTAFLNSVGTLVTFARTLFIVGVAALPWVVALGLPFAGVAFGVRRGLRRRRGGPGGPGGATPPTPADEATGPDTEAGETTDERAGVTDAADDGADAEEGAGDGEPDDGT